MLYSLIFLAAWIADYEPPIRDVELFGHIPQCVIPTLLAFNKEYRKHLEAQAAIYPSDNLHEAVLETNRLYRAWALLFDVQTPYLTVTARRQKLGELRELIGPQMYYRGEMPYHVNLRYFQVLR